MDTYIDFAQGLTRLSFLGRGAGFLPSEGNTSAFLKHESTIYLFDCGETVFSKIMEKNILKDITKLHIFITHLHADHIGSLSTLLMYCHYKTNIEVTVYSYSDTLKKILDKQSETELSFKYVNWIAKCNEYEYAIIDDEFSIMYNKTYHCNSKTLALSYTFYYNGDIIFYSGDTALKSFDWIKYLIHNENACAIYMDTSLNGNPEAHVSIHQLAKHLSPEERKKIYCMHIDSLELINYIEDYGFNLVENI